ncbi:MAG TPA: MBL fold metallo-hydrolase [Phycisphaerae bacterium]|nr:MBL fold metallo-hydrolase [Phycisphaerae bacterium]HNU44029.1 MBL fold metallo-hydrolase [Phycisphaerae bacterium]
MAELMFHGAVEEVTGSLHLVRVDDRWVALDCGMFHGRRAEMEEKNRAWPVPPAKLSAVVLSHAHIDHSGRLPRLVRDGFDGPIYCTPATRDLCAIMLADSAHIQEEDVYYVNKRRRRKGLEPIEPLYEGDDALAAVGMMQTVSYDRWFSVVPGLLASFVDAGHMLGSAGIYLEFAKRNGHTPSLFFSGDTGRPNKPIIRDPHPFPKCGTIICESTYGNRDNEPVEQARAQLVEVVQRTYARGGKLIIPAFSVGRTQTIAYYLQEELSAGRIPPYPIYVDSPLAVDATEVFLTHPECYDQDARALHARTGSLLGPSCCTYIRDVEESKRLHARKEPCTILSASGMCEAGRIRHHIKNNVENPNNTILIAGYQAANTLGRRLADGANEINLFNETYAVRAAVVQIHGFSAHADRTELLRLLTPLKDESERICLVHGEPDQRQALAATLREMGFPHVELPGPGHRLTL